jgi:hypothetical protein
MPVQDTHLGSQPLCAVELTTCADVPQYNSLVLDGKLLLRGKLPGFHKMWYDACHAAKARGGSFKGMGMSFQVGGYSSWLRTSR